MKVTYNESEKSIEIKDGLKNTYLILKLLMILNLVNALIRLIGRHKTEYGIIEYFWIAIGIVSLLVLYFFLFKKSAAQKIDVQKIDRLKEKAVLGKKRYSLLLKNGKERDLGNFKSGIELTEVRELFTSVGIEN